MGTHSNGLLSHWFSVLKFLFMFYLIPVNCASYCYYYYSYYYFRYRLSCYYYYYYYYYTSYSYKSIGPIIGMAVGGVVGSIVFIIIVIAVCGHICKKKNKRRVIVQPLHPAISFVHTTHSTKGGHSPLYYNYKYPPSTYPSHVSTPPMHTPPSKVHSQIPKQAKLPS